ncbi:MAG TPA: CDP-diacylglycerol--glycerol-3-phosphate 3-phosphatidyltransferase [Candidatus Megaira endosymbiont of Nemacystus decipiens]|nr:CDP-diacylglycerol--glycerol-3-phosphate 3-phosphatidyltransferase [Candidatus Megaera endosymbiont of Nemacystus decipiens]
MKIDKNLPNYLTVLRIVAIPIIIATFYFDNSSFAHQLGGILFIFASLTDFLDGYIARKYNLVSSFGKVFDPIADKVLVGCTLLMLVRNGNAPAIPCLLILSREFIVSGFREFLIQVKVSLPVSQIAKIKTTIQMFSIAILIIGSKGSGIESLDLIGKLLLWLATFMTIISGYAYFKACMKHF